MKALLIDPDNQWIKEIEGDFSDYKKIQEVVGGTFTLAGYVKDSAGNVNVVYCDDEGLFKKNDILTTIDAQGFYSPLAGALLVVGDNGSGDSCDVFIGREEMEAKVEFLKADLVLKMTREGLF